MADPVVDLATPGASAAAGARHGVPSAADLIAAGQFADATAICAEEIATCRSAVQTFESFGRLTPKTTQALDTRIAAALELLAQAELGMRDFRRALAHSAEAVETAGRLTANDPEQALCVARALTTFAAVRLVVGADLPLAVDAAAQAAAIFDGLDWNSPGTYRGRAEQARMFGAQILDLIKHLPPPVNGRSAW